MHGKRLLAGLDSGSLSVYGVPMQIELEQQLDAFFQNKPPALSAMTMAIVHDADRVLLGLKKRKLGAGLWNGFGGRVEPGESIADAARRELREESGIVTEKLRYHGLLRVIYLDWQQLVDIHVFGADAYRGEPIETDEMAPQWFLKHEVPYEHMWPDDRLWLPLLFSGKCFSAVATYRRTALHAPRMTVEERAMVELP